MQIPTIQHIHFEDVTNLPRSTPTHGGQFTKKSPGQIVAYTAPKDHPEQVTEQKLPADGWAFAIPAGMIMALRLRKGAIEIFESDKDYQDGANTHRVVIAS